MSAATLGNGVLLANTYDLDYRLSRKQATGAAALQDVTLGYDPASNIASIADAVTTSLSETYQYDLVGRVLQGTGAWGAETYRWDGIGNRLERYNATTFADTVYTINTVNSQLTKAVTGTATLNYAYAANGSLLTRKLGTTTQAAYTYNADARLSASGTTALKYNAFGERSVETITGGGTHFVFAPDGLLLAEHTTTGAQVRNYVYLNGQPLAVIDAAGVVSYILNDQVGQPEKMLNAAGAVSWHRVAGIFGDTVSQPVGSTAANPQRFPGQQFDPNLALHYNYFRDYDPATGRYLETDPIGLDGGMGLYAYVDGNPVSEIDPLGLSSAIYDGQSHTLTIIGKDGTVIGVYPANNRTTRSSNGPWPNGTYPYSHYNAHPESNAKGPFGENGISVFDVPGRSGMGIHAGRANRAGPNYPTLGCVRTTDEATAFIRALQKYDPVTSLKVVHNTRSARRIGKTQ